MLSGTRAGLDVEDLLKIVLVLVIVLLALEVVGAFVDVFLGLLRPLVALAILAIVVLYLLDRI